MSSFTEKLIVSPLSDGDLWRLEKNFKYHIGELGSENIITVPEGFVTDFASVPKSFWSFLPPWGKYGKSAILHDYLYETKIYDRKRSDQIFLESMQVLGVNWITRYTMYFAVRVFGIIEWNKKNN